MNLGSTNMHLEVAKVGEQYVVRVSYDNDAGSVGGSHTEVVSNRETLVKYLGLLVNYVPQ